MIYKSEKTAYDKTAMKYIPVWEFNTEDTIKVVTHVDEETLETKTFDFYIVAQTVGNSMPSEEDALTGNLVQLGIYESQEEMQNALNQLVNWLTDSSYPILHMPQPDAE